MKIVIAIDSFKGSLSSKEAGETAAKAARRVFGTAADVQVFPLADGGEGTVETLASGLGGEIVNVQVTGPLGAPVTACYGFLPQRKTAIIEMASAAGLTLVPLARRNPLHTTTYGLGELILAAKKQGCRNFIIGIGGSATNDCGLGMLTALGVVFYKKSGEKAGVFGRDLEDIASMDLTQLRGNLQGCHFQIACDVDNPLCGTYGCSKIYGAQKGATPQIIEQMDRMIAAFAQQVRKQEQIGEPALAGAGAAGGLGYAFNAFLGGRLRPGIELVLDVLSIESSLTTADLLITGEGRLDAQTAMGKAPIGIAKLAKRVNPKIGVVAFCGCTKEGAQDCNTAGIDAYFPILRRPLSEAEAMQPEVAKTNLQATAIQVYRLWSKSTT